MLHHNISQLSPMVAQGIAQGENMDHLIAPILRAQRIEIPLVDRFLRASGVESTDPWWRHAIPTDFFRQAKLFAGKDREIVQTFLSSGTSGAPKSQAPYSQVGLELMATAIHKNGADMLFPDGLRTRILILAPPPDVAAQMIMAWGMNKLIQQFGAPGSAFLIGSGPLDFHSVIQHLNQAKEDNLPVTLIGASFAFVHFLDHLSTSHSLQSPLPGSRIMHAGGFKGRSREIEGKQLKAQLAKAFHIPHSHILNLLGMTELSSQFYDDCLRAAVANNPSEIGKVNAPWTKTEVIAPNSLTPVSVGERGLLVHLDLANLERPVAIRTSDIGIKLTKGFEIIGRAKGADPAGCSLTIEELLQGDSRD